MSKRPATPRPTGTKINPGISSDDVDLWALGLDSEYDEAAIQQELNDVSASWDEWWKHATTWDLSVVAGTPLNQAMIFDPDRGNVATCPIGESFGLQLQFRRLRVDYYEPGGTGCSGNVDSGVVHQISAVWLFTIQDHLVFARHWHDRSKLTRNWFRKQLQKALIGHGASWHDDVKELLTQKPKAVPNPQPLTPEAQQVPPAL